MDKTNIIIIKSEKSYRLGKETIRAYVIPEADVLKKIGKE